MELTVSRQRVRLRPNGMEVFKGEDARPYAGDMLFMVLDGLGGSASIRQPKIDRRMFDGEKLPDLLFRGVYGNYSDPRFLEYVRGSFFELYPLRDVYSSDIKNLKASGYFASRFVACILLHEVLYKAGEIHSLFTELRMNPQYEATTLKLLGETLAELIRKKLPAIAENARVFNESAFENMAFLGTTLCATLFEEDGTGVDCLYLTAGDSRPYVWTEAEGLAQLLPDEENDAGVVNNCISCTPGSTFHIRCHHFRFEKPCILFNATDGCFDSAAFPSQMAFEEVLLRSIADSADTDGAAEALTGFFLNAGRHDDSSTIALKAFGYESYEDLAAAARRRLETLHSTYCVDLPDLLETNYARKLHALLETGASSLTELKERAFRFPVVEEYCRATVLSFTSGRFREGVKAMEARKADAEKALADADRQAEGVLRRCFSAVLRAAGRIDGYPMPNTFDADRARSALAACKREYADSLRLHTADFEQSMETLRRILGVLNERGLDFLDEGPGSVDFSGLSAGAACLQSAAGFLRELQQGRFDTMRRYAVLRDRYAESERRLAERNASTFGKCRELLLSGQLDLENADLSEANRSALAAAREAREAAAEALAQMDGDREGLLADCVREYWEAHFPELLADLLGDPQAELPEELRAEAAGLLRNRSRMSEGLARAAVLQDAAFRKYDLAYRRYLEGV